MCTMILTLEIWPWVRQGESILWFLYAPHPPKTSFASDLNPGVGRPGCVISVQKGVKTVNAMSAEKRTVRKWSFLLYISHHQGLKDDLLTLKVGEAKNDLKLYSIYKFYNHMLETVMSLNITTDLENLKNIKLTKVNKGKDHKVTKVIKGQGHEVTKVIIWQGHQVTKTCSKDHSSQIF